MELPKSGFFSTVFSALLRPYLQHLDKPSLPKYRGQLALAGLKQPVRVRWDSFVVPHVTAADEVDLFFSQGFLHAQERLWQMELSRREIEEAFRSGIRDAHITYHAGLIFSAAGDLERGASLMREAAVINPRHNNFHVHR